MDNELMIRTSERTCFKSCRQKWEWAYIYQLKSNRPASALEFGSLIHNALELWYIPGKKRGKNPVKSIPKLYKKYLASGGNEIFVKIGSDSVEADELGVEMMRMYLEEFGDDERYEVISSEQTFQIDVDDPETDEYLFTYVGTFDGVWKDLSTGQIGFAEHKTGATLEPFGAPLTLDEQSGAYWTFGPDWMRHKKILKKGQQVDFLLFNRLRKAMPDSRPSDEQGRKLNKDGTVSKQQPAPYFKRELVYRNDADRAIIMDRAINEVKEMQMVRSGDLAVYKNPDKHCTFCEFRDMCEVHETGSDWEALGNSMFTTWEPYGAHQ